MRYARQTILPEVGPSGQKALTRAKVLCVGAGGLGSPAALYLAAAGVGRIGIVDPDKVEISNLQRQILFCTSENGQPKTTAAKRRIIKLNPTLRVDTYHEAIDSKNALRIFKKYDVVIDGTDNFAAKFLINDAAVKLGLPVVYGSIDRFEGHAAVFWAKQGACYRCLYRHPPKTFVPSCAEAGVIGAVAGVIGSIQALETIKIILNSSKSNVRIRPLIGTLLSLDGQDMSIRKISIPKQPDCPVCSIAPTAIRLIDEGIVCSTQRELTPDQYKRVAKSSLLLDVREKSEWELGHLPGALHWPLSKLKSGEIPKIDLKSKKKLIVYCQSGIRSLEALNLLVQAGYIGVSHLKGGMSGLTKKQK
jgi:adenylyltransferase/sulfurtransferase